ncbi:MAG: hypothetical protein IPM06_19015 [Rhizobiales bacterium]|nr:hypothetical protein [Hyphomicrobiales bacterium]
MRWDIDLDIRRAVGLTRFAGLGGGTDVEVTGEGFALVKNLPAGGHHLGDAFRRPTLEAGFRASPPVIAADSAQQQVWLDFLAESG